MSLILASDADMCQDILAIVRQPRADGFVPIADRPDARFGRFSKDGTPRISPSQVNTLRMCPQRWKRQYLDGDESPGSYQSIVGSIGHAAMETALATWQDPVGPRALRDAVTTAAQVHLADPATLAGSMNGRQADVFGLATRLGDAVHGLWNWFLKQDVTVEAVEERIIGRYDHAVAVDSLGFVDVRIDVGGRSKIIDWKFPGRGPWMVGGEADARDSYRLAMQMYADAYGQQGRAIDEALIVHAPLDGSPVAAAREVITEASTMRSRDAVHGAIDVILDGELPADPVTPGPLCSTTWCPFYVGCQV